MKFYVSVFSQETNTFSPLKTDRELFSRGYIYHNDEILKNLKDSNTEAGGAIEFCEKNGIEIVWGPAYYAVAAGKVKDDFFESVKNEIIDGYKNAGKVDGVLLCLHGAMVSESKDDCEGDILESLRKVCGPKMPVALTLDYHANLTKKMVDNMDVCAGFCTYPHVDFANTALRACDALKRLVESGEKTIKTFHKIPMIVPVENSETGKGICKEVMDEIKTLASMSDVFSAAFFCAQPWLDIEEMGLALVSFSSAKASNSFFEEKLNKLADLIESSKRSLIADYQSLTDVLNKADSYVKPAALVDSGDITTAGAIGDSTEMLRGFLSKKYSVAMAIVSPKAVEKAFEIGAGNKGTIVIGGDSQDGYNNDVEVSAEVIKTSTDVSIIHGESFNGLEVDCGKKAYVRINGRVNIILAQYPAMMFDPQFFLDMDINPSDMDFIVMKSHKLFRSAYKNITKETVIVDTLGCTSMNIAQLDYKKVKKDIFPFVI